jgi:hypothetical protein
MRLLHRLYAFFFGCFWVPCPICGAYFGGHECDGERAIIDPFSELHMPDGSRTSTGKCVCRKCGPKAERINSMPLVDRKNYWSLWVLWRSQESERRP